MNRDEAKELLPIIQAFADGKTIEFKTGSGEWLVTTNPLFTSNTEYRTKPEPKEFWVMIYGASMSASIYFDSKEYAEKYLKKLRDDYPYKFENAYITKVREVLQDD